MSTKNAILAIAIVAMCSACQKNEPKQQDNSISIAKQAEMVVTSGGHTLAMKTSAGSGQSQEAELQYFKKSNCPDLYKADFPEQKLGKEECEYVYACIKQDAALIAEGKDPIYEIAKNSFTEKAFYIVNAYSSKDHDAKGDHSSVAGDMHDLGMNNVKIKEFNTNTCVAADLILTQAGLQDVTYDDSFGVKKAVYTVSNWKLFFIPDYGYYIGMDYGSEKVGTPGDGDYSDWVIKVIPAVKHEEPIGEVEINLSVNDEHIEGDFIATKLSIHIRALTDVEVFIPVDKKFYCQADDMDISLSHREPNMVYNTDPQYVEMQIGATTVTFTVQYEDEGIRVTTDGVNKSVIDYCAEFYADGITFEIWNYFKDITRADLKTMLDKSTVTFLDENPALYINAFAKLTGYPSPIYNKFNDAGQLVPYTDADCTMPLDQKYWTRINPSDKDYVFVGYPNPMDCTVKPLGATYEPSEPDVEDPTLPNYNIEYNLK